MNSWYLIYCKPGQDSIAETNLIRQGFTVFRPTINMAKTKIGCKTYLKCESLFPRYLFIKVNPEVKSIFPVSSTLGVSTFVKFGDRYATASEDLIEEIKSIVEKQKFLASEREKFKKGDMVYVDGNGFDQVKAIYCNPCGNQRAMILMDILGKESRLRVPMQCVSRVVS